MIFNIEKLRKDLITKRVIDRKLTVRQVAVMIGTSAATISRIENSKLPDVETFAKCCIWLETDAKSYFIVQEDPYENRQRELVQLITNSK